MDLAKFAIPIRIKRFVNVAQERGYAILGGLSMPTMARMEFPSTNP